ncbi:MAG: zinc ribbon domain-containing protein [Clostridia bacterium]|nr:zinc ribbon domain-containing protein [Clostridia bacterium]
MDCPKCKTKLSENANFCTVCGTPRPAQRNIFAYISAGICAAMILLFFLPWLVVEDGSFNVFTILTILPVLYLIRSFPFLVCSVFILFSGGLLIAALILTLMKKGMSKGFVIASSVLIFITIFFFWFFDLMFEFASSSPVSVIMFILAIVNIAFNELARKI